MRLPVSAGRRRAAARFDWDRGFLEGFTNRCFTHILARIDEARRNDDQLIIGLHGFGASAEWNGHVQRQRRLQPSDSSKYTQSRSSRWMRSAEIPTGTRVIAAAGGEVHAARGSTSPSWSGTGASSVRISRGSARRRLPKAIFYVFREVLFKRRNRLLCSRSASDFKSMTSEVTSTSKETVRPTEKSAGPCDVRARSNAL